MRASFYFADVIAKAFEVVAGQSGHLESISSETRSRFPHVLAQAPHVAARAWPWRPVLLISGKWGASPTEKGIAIQVG
jgi:hypothetical protein